MGEEWDSLRRGGQNGFFIIILAFSWWVEVKGGEFEDADIHAALVDLTWVVRCIGDTDLSDQLIGGKRVLEDDKADTSSHKKQYVISFSLFLGLIKCHAGGLRREIGAKGH